MDELNEATRIAAILEAYIERFNNLLADHSTNLDESSLKEEASALKEEIRAEHKRMSGSKFAPKSSIERAFLVPAIRQANGEFSKYPIAAPKSSRWHVGLNAVRGEFSYHLGRLAESCPGAVSKQIQ